MSLEERQKKTILVVDDEEDFLFTVKNVIESSHREYETITIDSCKKCLDILQKNAAPDLILLDLMLPEMTGTELYKILKQNEKWKHIPIIITTAWDQLRENLTKTIDKHDFLDKPFGPNDLIKKIDKYLKK